jgi:hypothetical protein
MVVMLDPVSVKPIDSLQSRLLRRQRSGFQFKASLGKKLARTHLKQWAEHGGTHMHLSYLGGINKRITVQAGQVKMEDPI